MKKRTQLMLSGALIASLAALAMTAIDTTNLRLGFAVPASGKVMVRMDENGRMQATCFENLERVYM